MGRQWRLFPLDDPPLLLFLLLLFLLSHDSLPVDELPDERLGELP